VGIDPLVFRLLFLLSTLAAGAGLVAYLVLAAVLPSSSPDLSGVEPSEVVDGLADTTAGLRLGALAGLALVGVGLLVLAGQFGWLAWLGWHTVWPIVIILLGMGLLLGRSR
jgi:phage shock protein C